MGSKTGEKRKHSREREQMPCVEGTQSMARWLEGQVWSELQDEAGGRQPAGAIACSACWAMLKSWPFRRELLWECGKHKGHPSSSSSLGIK